MYGTIAVPVYPVSNTIAAKDNPIVALLPSIVRGVEFGAPLAAISARKGVAREPDGFPYMVLSPFLFTPFRILSSDKDAPFAGSRPGILTALQDASRPRGSPGSFRARVRDQDFRTRPDKSPDSATLARRIVFWMLYGLVGRFWMLYGPMGRFFWMLYGTI